MPVLPSTKKTPAYTTLVGVILMGAIAIAITASLLLLGVGNSRSSHALEQSMQAKGLANACAEEALQQIRDLSSFTGTGNLTLGPGTCEYQVIDDGGENRTVRARGFVGNIVRKVLIDISAINPSIVVDSWKEVADF